jgi:hypothetical protein
MTAEAIPVTKRFVSMDARALFSIAYGLTSRRQVVDPLFSIKNQLDLRIAAFDRGNPHWMEKSLIL